MLMEPHDADIKDAERLKMKMEEIMDGTAKGNCERKIHKGALTLTLTLALTGRYLVGKFYLPRGGIAGSH